jgi:hypothetical protein
MSSRFDIRVDGQPVKLHDDAAMLIHLLTLLTTADEVDRVLLAAEGIRHERCEDGTWEPSADWSEFAASVRERMLTVAL